jgi:hypothetical protein
MCTKCMYFSIQKSDQIFIMIDFLRHNNSLLLSTGFLGDVLTLKKTLDGRIKVRNHNLIDIGFALDTLYISELPT